MSAQVYFRILHEPNIVHWFYDKLVPLGKAPWSDRLPNDLLPMAYDLTIKTNIPSSAQFIWQRNFTYDGSISVSYGELRSETIEPFEF